MLAEDRDERPLARAELDLFKEAEAPVVLDDGFDCSQHGSASVFGSNAEPQFRLL